MASTARLLRILCAFVLLIGVSGGLAQSSEEESSSQAEEEAHEQQLDELWDAAQEATNARMEAWENLWRAMEEKNENPFMLAFPPDFAEELDRLYESGDLPSEFLEELLNDISAQIDAQNAHEEAYKAYSEAFTAWTEAQRAEDEAYDAYWDAL